MGWRRGPLPGEEGGHREARGWVVPYGVPPRHQRGLAGPHAADVQRRDLDRGAGDLLVGQVLVHKTVHTTMYLLQVHLLVLEEEEGWRRREGGRRGGVEGGIEGGRRDTEAEIGEVPGSQAFGAPCILTLILLVVCHCLTWPFFQSLFLFHFV